ncbi:PREDICTED: nascent polypeptide-associated complex subunit alpha, muscle-specific form-like [Gavialis gangeticus]|uniref:nascent polypeptide-associated complex subunit alpha, muscle-specific form-like n=1 Tax=Gavialis gangeticus TaxID=94835 RepID=UPI00092E89E7|nr:PREDICTED: nascent polypeptide-associated complex subunit alpha, muscle-specific form-like [Gavialis gangeticus]XP_019365272.1 PREDICTED: nascent polypeptide-associated complex subunit alpha, muscle-specific form-like [Gavialis gangeticus]
MGSKSSKSRLGMIFERLRERNAKKNVMEIKRLPKRFAAHPVAEVTQQAPREVGEAQLAETTVKKLSEVQAPTVERGESQVMVTNVREETEMTGETRTNAQTMLVIPQEVEAQSAMKTSQISESQSLMETESPQVARNHDLNPAAEPREVTKVQLVPPSPQSDLDDVSSLPTSGHRGEVQDGAVMAHGSTEGAPENPDAPVTAGESEMQLAALPRQAVSQGMGEVQPATGTSKDSKTHALAESESLNAGEIGMAPPVAGTAEETDNLAMAPCIQIPPRETEPTVCSLNATTETLPPKANMQDAAEPQAMDRTVQETSEVVITVGARQEGLLETEPQLPTVSMLETARVSEPSFMAEMTPRHSQRSTEAQPASQTVPQATGKAWLAETGIQTTAEDGTADHIVEATETCPCPTTQAALAAKGETDETQIAAKTSTDTEALPSTKSADETAAMTEDQASVHPMMGKGKAQAVTDVAEEAQAMQHSIQATEVQPTLQATEETGMQAILSTACEAELAMGGKELCPAVDASQKATEEMGESLPGAQGTGVQPADAFREDEPHLVAEMAQGTTEVTKAQYAALNTEEMRKGQLRAQTTGDSEAWVTPRTVPEPTEVSGLAQAIKEIAQSTVERTESQDTGASEVAHPVDIITEAPPAASIPEGAGTTESKGGKMGASSQVTSNILGVNKEHPEKCKTNPEPEPQQIMEQKQMALAPKTFEPISDTANLQTVEAPPTGLSMNGVKDRHEKAEGPATPPAKNKGALSSDISPSNHGPLSLEKPFPKDAADPVPAAMEPAASQTR